MYVYRLLNEKSEVVYVGKTNDLKKRYLSHIKGIGLDTKKEFNKMEYFEVLSQSDMTIYEILFINFYKPKYNLSFKAEDFICDELASIANRKQWVKFDNDLEISAMDMALDKSRGKYNIKKEGRVKSKLSRCKLKAVLKKRNIKMSQLSEMVGLSANTLSKYITMGVSDNLLSDICIKLECDSCEILEK